jgi:hypothetical protein
MIQEFARNTDNLSIGSISPATGAGDGAGFPLRVGPDLTVRA